MLQDNKFDLWLKRTGYFVQIGIFLIMAITIYYTVMPLYKIASLEEAIALKERELKALNIKINSFEQKERLMSLVNYTSTISFYCTSLSKTAMTPTLLESNNDPFDRRQPKFLNTNIEECLKKTEYVNIVRYNLSNRDKAVFDKELSILVAKIAKLRQEKLNEYYNAGNELTNNPSKFISENRIYAQIIELSPSINRDITIYNDRINSDKVNSILSIIEAKFEKDIRYEIHKFREINWQDSNL